MRKIPPLLLVLIIFIFLSLYVHQKVQIYATAFDLNRNYKRYQELAAKKDYLVHNFSKKVSLSYVSNWLSDENFSPPEKEKLLVFNLDDQNKVKTVQKRPFFQRLKPTASISDVFAKER